MEEFGATKEFGARDCEDTDGLEDLQMLKPGVQGLDSRTSLCEQGHRNLMVQGSSGDPGLRFEGSAVTSRSRPTPSKFGGPSPSPP